MKFSREYNEDGIKEIWNYDTDKFKNGPVSVEITYLKSIKTFEQEQDKENLPKTQRKYLNTTNGKYVGYSRAKTLGIIS